jgi:hypothetical protein
MLVLRTRAGPNISIEAVTSVLKYGSYALLALAAMATSLDAIKTWRTSTFAQIDEPARRLQACALTVVSLMLLLFAALHALPPSSGSSAPQMVVLNEGGLDWARPVHGKYRPFDAGMFGLLPVYSYASGCHFAVTDRKGLLDGSVDTDQVLVLINTSTSLGLDVSRAIREFMERGGNVLVLGDHTNVFGLMNSLNPFLLPYGAAFRFDSAYHNRSEWKCNYYFGQSAPMLPGIFPNTGHGIGASIALRWPMRPMFMGRYAFSDFGDKHNYPGSFLGNYSLDTDEHIGDLVLACWRPVGAGRLVIYGDTSAFQNNSLPYTWTTHVLPLLEWMSTPNRWWESNAFHVLLCVASMLASFGLMFVKEPTPVQVLALAVAAMASVCGLYAAPRRQLPIAADRANGVVLCDYSLFPRIGHYEAAWNDIGPLYSEIHRAGLIAFTTNDLVSAALAGPRAIAIIAPSRGITQAETAAILSYAERGLVLVSAGYRESAALAPLFDQLGVEIVPIPLGRQPRNSARTDYKGPQFRDAWPIRYAGDSHGNSFQPIFATDGNVLAAYIARGDGGFIIIGDSRFWSSTNVERMYWHDPGTLAFIYEVFERYAHVDHVAVEPLYASPLEKAHK